MAGAASRGGGEGSHCPEGELIKRMVAHTTRDPGLDPGTEKGPS